LNRDNICQKPVRDVLNKKMPQLSQKAAALSQTDETVKKTDLTQNSNG
jgi:hypothetical protein